jgi:hypothetical protein
MVSTRKPKRSPKPPRQPKKGHKFYVQTGTHWAIGTNYSVRNVSSKSFFVYSEGKVNRFLLSEWQQWLMDRFSEGVLHYNGLALQSPATLNAVSQAPKKNEGNQYARDQRLLRASQAVNGKYKFIREDNDEHLVHFDVHGGTHVYRICVSRTNGHRLSCSCPDAQRNAKTSKLLCKHLIAVLMANADLRFHLLDILL